MIWVLTAAVALILLLLRWRTVSRQRRRSMDASPVAGSVVTDLRRAASLEARDWLLTGLVIFAAVALAFAFVSYVGPFKPIHEWFK